MKRLGIFAVAGVVLALAAGWLLAVESVNVEQSFSEEQGSAGRSEGGPSGPSAGGAGAALYEDVVLNSLGKLKLGHKIETLLKDDKDVAFVNALAADDKGNVYVATAPAGKLFRISPAGEKELWYTAKEKTLQSLAIGSHGEVYLGTGGGVGKIYRIAAKNVAELVLDRPAKEDKTGKDGKEAKDGKEDKDGKDGLAYIWAMVVLPDGKLVAGTGPNAELIALVPNGKPQPGEVLFKPEKDKQKNILSLVADSAGKTLYFGTDTDGLVFKFDLAARKPFLVYDADESEIASLALAADGVLYAGTSDPRATGDSEGSGDMPFGHSGMGGPSGPGMIDDSTADDQKDADEESDKPDESGSSAKSLVAALASAAKAKAGEIGKALHATPAGSPGDSADSPAPAAGPARPPSPATRPEAKAAKTPAGKPVAKSPTTGPESGHGAKAFGPSLSAMRSMRSGSRGPSGPFGGGGGGGGNAVYRIAPQGFVTEVLRRPSMMLALLLQGNKLIVATGGSEGRVLSVSTAAGASDEISTLAKPKDVKQVMALAPARDGAIYIGTANNAIIGKVQPGYAAKGTFTSRPIDAKAVARWGVISEKSDTAEGGSVRVQTRSGNLADPEDSLWSAWSEPMAASEAVAINSPPARFIQYRLVLASDKADVTPVVDSVTVSYIHDNQAPKLTMARAVPPGAGPFGGEGGGGGMFGRGGGPERMMGGSSGPSGPRSSSPSRMIPSPSRSGGGPSGPRMMGGGPEGGGGAVVDIVWAASDPNDDTLEYMLYFRKAGSQVWVPLTEKPIQQDSFQWPTRGLPDGQYQVKVVASDLPGNTPATAKKDTRLTDLFTVNNTPPVIANFRVVDNKPGKVTLAAEVTSALSRLASGRAKVDSFTEDGQVVLPVSGIWDQKTAELRFTVDLSAKPPAAGHLILLTVTDVAGNVASASVEVGKP